MSRPIQIGRHSLFGAGHALLQRCMPTDMIEDLTADAERYRFDPAVPSTGGTAATASRDDPAPARAARWFADAAALADLGGPFDPNDAGYHRTPPGGSGPPPRRVARYYAECVAIAVLRGRATVTVHAERHRDQILDECSAGPGDVLLLRGWSPLGRADPRPYHRIVAEGGRECLTVRLGHNLAATTPPSAWLSGLTRAEITTAGLLAARPVSPPRPGLLPHR